MGRILIVDDEPDLRFLVRRLLERRGHEVVEAANGRDALERVRQERPDCVILDNVMPVMSGSEMIERLRADPDTADLRVILWSAAPDREAQADAVLSKPYAGPELVRLVDRFVED